MDADRYPANTSRGPLLLASAFTLHAITIIVYLIRLYSRLTPRFALTAADYTITVAVVSRTLSVIFTTTAVQHGFGRHTVYIPPSDLSHIRVYIFTVFICSALSSGFARISIACLLLQVTQKRSWRAAIISTIVLQALMISLYIITQLVQCSSVIESGTNRTTCLPPSHIRSFTLAQISIAMFSDFICAFIPIFLIRSLTRSLVEKVLTSVLLASCLVASGIGIAKIYFQITYDFASEDSYYLLTYMFFWSRLEEGLIIVAACAPLLRQPIEAGLKRCGFSGFSVPEPELATIESLAGSDQFGYRGRKLLPRESEAALKG